MGSKLVIVESPIKAKTIEGYLGGGYKVRSCNGHIRDLPEKELGVDIENGFIPTYVVNPAKQSVVKELTEEVQKADVIYLASDDDREGEAIALHVKETLQLSEEQAKRITFRAITKKDIAKAIENPRHIDMARVKSQEARRILDRIVGYMCSPLLWKAIKSNLSAGRVQSVALRLIVEREDEIHRFVAKSHFKVIGQFVLGEGVYLKAELTKPWEKEEEASAFLADCRGAVFRIEELKQTESKRNPSAPFTTSSLQQVASQQLGFSIKETMAHAQRLYEEGKITYMRTDATNLGEEAYGEVKRAIEQSWGKEYYEKRTYKSESDIAQEAHEAIRPTDMMQKVGSESKRVQRLYTLIREHTLASQMKAAIFHKTTAHIGISTRPEQLVAKGEVLHWKGFLAAYQASGLAEKGKALPPLEVNQILSLHELEARETFSRPPARYTEASLVQQLKDLQIGRPSTYVPIISTIQHRDYVLKESREGKIRRYKRLLLKGLAITQQIKEEKTGSEKTKLFPTDTGIVVNDFLTRYCDIVVDYQFTARIEKELDKIARQSLAWQEMLTHFYGQFEQQIEKASRADAPIKVRNLGVDEATKQPVIARFSKRYGPLVQMGEMDSDTKPRFASPREGQLLEYITLAEALALFQLPRDVGTFEGEPIIAQVGRYGPYLKHKGDFYSIYKPLDAYTIEEGSAIEVIKKKRETPQRVIKSFAEDASISVRAGRFGPYIKTAERNIRVPKGQDVASLTWEACQSIIAEAPATKRKRSRVKKK